MTLRPSYTGPMRPAHPCREIPTRHCPAIYDDVCGDRPCARYEAEDPEPWLPEITDDPAERARLRTEVAEARRGLRRRGTRP